jgi:RNA polymerase sigma factor (TIGR02999 family)
MAGRAIAVRRRNRTFLLCFAPTHSSGSWKTWLDGYIIGFSRMSGGENITVILQRLSEGDSKAGDELFTLVYAEFRRMARHLLAGQLPYHTLEPTALVHEAYLKMVDGTRTDWKNRSHFFAVGAVAMRHILVNHALAKGATKRGSGAIRVALHDEMLSPERDQDVLVVDEALKELAALNERYAKIVEYRFFGGLTWEETAEALDMTPTAVRRHWNVCRAWLRERLAS